MTNPLSPYAAACLKQIVSEGPVPAQQFNPGVIGKLVREGLATCVQMPSPYKTGNGKMIPHLEATTKARVMREEGRSK